MSLPIACHTDHFGTLGQIDPSHLTEIVKQGYKSVINNRPDFEGHLKALVFILAMLAGMAICNRFLTGHKK